MADRRPSAGGNKLSPQTLIVASLASLTAAIVTSTFWEKGTPITAAISPVIVAIASELYSRPARRIAEFSSRASTRTGEVRSARFRERERVAVGAPQDRRPAPAPPEGPEMGPVNVYRSGGRARRRINLKLAIVTAAIAFVIALVVLTVPELVFGGSVASHGDTTFFGGGSSHKAKKPSQTNPTQTTPRSTTSPSHTGTSSTPTTTAPPAQTTPETTTPVSPPSSGTPAPKGTTGP